MKASQLSDIGGEEPCYITFTFGLLPSNERAPSFRAEIELERIVPWLVCALHHLDEVCQRGHAEDQDDEKVFREKLHDLIELVRKSMDSHHI